MHIRRRGSTISFDTGAWASRQEKTLLLHIFVMSRFMSARFHARQESDPSKEDIDTTHKIVQALKYVGARVLDHIIVGRTQGDSFSFARAGMV